jgi:hypothetical protein
MRSGNRTVQGFLSTQTTTDNRPEAGGLVEEITGGTAVLGRAKSGGVKSCQQHGLQRRCCYQHNMSSPGVGLGGHVSQSGRREARCAGGHPKGFGSIMEMPGIVGFCHELRSRVQRMIG